MRIMQIANWKRMAVAMLALLPVNMAAQALPDAPRPAPAESADWTRLENLSHGERVTVRHENGHPLPCLFAGATRDYLFCDSIYSGRQYRFERSQVQRVRRDDRRRNVHIAIGGLAAAGFIWGVTIPPDGGTPRALNALVGAGIGAFTGLLVSLPVMFIPGRTVFHQPVTKNKVAFPAPSPDAMPYQIAPPTASP